MNAVGYEPSTRTSVDLVDVCLALWRYKWFIVVSTFLCTVVAIVPALISTPIYRAGAVVTEVRDNAFGGSAPLMGQIGGLANLAGINLGGARNPETQAMLKSRHLAEEFISRHQLIPLMFPDAKE